MALAEAAAHMAVRVDLQDLALEMVELITSVAAQELHGLVEAEAVAEQVTEPVALAVRVLLLSPSISFRRLITIQIQLPQAQYPLLHGHKVLLVNHIRFKVKERLQNLASHLPAGIQQPMEPARLFNQG
jgi:hypothetical protein